jgi:hypothetical protein
MTIKPVSNTNYTLIQKQDIFDNAKNIVFNKHNGSTVIIPHVCNNIGVFNGGFAGAVAENYPIVKENYLLNTNMKLGNTQFITGLKSLEYGHELIFANMIAQNGVKNKKNYRPLNYTALAYCMSTVKLYLKEYRKKHDNQSIQIHCPKFGSGLAGGNWSFISELIKDTWSDIDVYVYTI